MRARLRQVCFAMQEADLALWSCKTGGSRAAGAVALDLLVVLVLGEVRAHSPSASSRSGACSHGL